VRGPRDIDIGDLGVRLRRAVPRNRILDRLAIPLENGLYAPVLAVADPTRESVAERVLPTVRPEVHSLDAAAKNHVGPGVHTPFNERRA